MEGDWLLAAVIRTQIALFVLAVTALTLYVVATRITGRRAFRLVHQGRTHLLAVVAGDPAAAERVPFLRSLSWSQQVQVFMDVVRSLDGDARDRVASIADVIGLTERAEQRCRSCAWWRRLVGARVLTALHRGHAVVPRMLGDRSGWVREQAVDWVGQTRRADLVPYVVGQLRDSRYGCHFAIRNTLLRLREAAVDALCEYLERAQGDEAVVALEIAAGIADARFRRAAVRLVGDPLADNRARAATLLGEIGGAEAPAVLLGLLDDDAASVRAASARSVVRLRHWPAAPRLGALLEDRSWQVRREAALALRSLGGPGLLFLRRSTESEDPFAADMARQVLELSEVSSRAVPA